MSIARNQAKNTLVNIKSSFQRAKVLRWTFSLILLFTISQVIGCAQVSQTTNQSDNFLDWSKTPAMGWNSWDCFGAGVVEEEVMANAEYMNKNLKSHGWNIITIDIQWYEPLAHTDQYRRFAALEMDEYGRLLPAPNRFPSTKDTRSFKPIADKIHAMGLKLGVHLMRGIPRQAVDQNVPILGTDVHAADIANTRSTCAWNTDMYGVDMTKPGAQEYYDSVFALLASWEIDFVKVDDLSAPSYNQPEVEAIRNAIDKSGRAIVLSTSPGATPLSAGEHVASHANMWRISNDFWDTWPALYAQFARLDNWTPYRGPGHFPDADMLPIGNIRTWQENNSWTRFTQDEQITLMTLWSIARSPLIIGAHMPKNDEFTLSLLTNDELISVNQKSTNNKQLFNKENHIVWVADVPDSEDKYVAFFNAKPAPAPRGRGRRGGGLTRGNTQPAEVDPTETQPAEISVSLSELGITGQCTVRDLWTHKDLGTFSDEISATVNSHGAAIYRISPK